MKKIKGCIIVFAVMLAVGCVMISPAKAGSCGGAGKQTSCPVTGAEVDKSLYTEKDGKRIYASNQESLNEIKTNFDKYATDLEGKGVNLKTEGE